MTRTSSDLSLEVVLSPSFKPSTLTKIQLRSLIAEYSDLPFEDIPQMSSKKEVFLHLFEERLIKRRTAILKAQKKEGNGKGIVVVNTDGTEKTVTGSPIEDNKIKRVSFHEGYFSDENPFQKPSLRKTPVAKVTLFLCRKIEQMMKWK